MYLKEIEIVGFKSFADKLNLKLDNNITCIVGPNGSGKSNVVDAVRWVLGEQSVKSLRGDGSMSDVIFSGSKSRGPSNVASVALIFDNSDHYLSIPYTEVSIKRRIYRTGENEYFLNGEKCRLKDLTDLFLDSGIGKESFNIISQGEVMRILSNSSLDRRVIFEEAARVLKYKKRKEEAIRKLDRTNQNLDRVSDIIQELERQVDPLKEQSRKAKEYLECRSNLEKHEVALLAYEISRLNEENIQMQNKMQKIEEESLTLSSDTSSVDAKVDVKRTELLKLEEEYKNKNQLLLDLTKDVERLNGEKKVLQERSKYDAQDVKVHEQFVTLNEKYHTLETSIFNCEQELEIIHLRQDTLEQEVQEKEEDLLSCNRKREDFLREYNTKSRDYLELKNRIQILEQSLENGGNMPSSVKAVLNNPRLRGVHSTLANLLDVDEKFAKALEVALASSKNAIVVESDQDAKDAIRYLKENHLGRATFFPIETMKPRFVDAETMQLLKSEMGYIDTFQHLVQYRPIYDSVVASQLGNVLVSLDIDSATRISKKIHNRYRIVTLDGDIIQVGGSMTGGSFTSFKSVLLDRQELESLKRKRVDLKAALLQIDQSLKELEEERKEKEALLYQKKQEFIEQQEMSRNKMASLQALKEQLEEVAKERSSLGAVISSSLEEEEEKLQQEYTQKVNERNALAHSLERLSFQKNRLSQEVDEMDAKNKERNLHLRKLEQESKSLELERNQNDMKLDRFLEILNEEYSMTFERAQKEYVLELEVEEAREKVSHYKRLLKQIGMVNLDAIDEFERVNERYTFLTKQKDDLEHAKESLFEIISEMDEVMEREFRSTFELIREEFQEVFRQLFGGGTATLRLSDPEHILTTGIDIIASPPGKKLTSINLLSGGEKTLTAISLLFAILNVRTVPFCLFDEVEAALDEANVDRFGTYLDHYKDKTQFLLITHKKKTMEYAKTLYGITMQESGVSKLVSVKFDQLESKV